MQKITEPPLTSCPFCKGKVKKLVSNCSFQLKGSGWYVTDYAKKSEKKEGKDKKPDVSKDKSKSKEKAQAKAVNQ